MPRKSRVSADTVRSLALALPHISESAHFAQPDFRVRNRIFATLPNCGDVVCLKTTPINLDALMAADSVTFRNEWRGRWLRVRLDRIAAPMLEQLLVDAWTLVAPKTLVKAFLATHE
jgi:hypothetical protein